jgi:hypothetical protein
MRIRAIPLVLGVLFLGPMLSCKTASRNNSAAKSDQVPIDPEYLAQAIEDMRDQIYYSELVDIGYVIEGYTEDQPEFNWDSLPPEKQQADLAKAKQKAEKKAAEREAYLRNRLSMTTEEIAETLAHGQPVDKEGNPIDVIVDPSKEGAEEWVRFKGPSGKIIRGKVKKSYTGKDLDPIIPVWDDGEDGHATNGGQRAVATYLFTNSYPALKGLVPVSVPRVFDGRDYYVRVRFEEELPFDLAKHKVVSKRLGKKPFELIEKTETFGEMRNMLVTSDPSIAQEDLIFERQASEYARVVDFITGQSDRHLNNYRYLPGKKPLWMDEELTFHRRSTGSISMSDMPKGPISQETKDFIRQISFESLARAGKQAGLTKLRTTYALLHLARLKANPDLIVKKPANGEDDNPIDIEYKKDIYAQSQEIRKTVETALESAGYPADYKYGHRDGDQAKKILKDLERRGFEGSFSMSDCQVDIDLKADQRTINIGMPNRDACKNYEVPSKGKKKISYVRIFSDSAVIELGLADSNQALHVWHSKDDVFAGSEEPGVRFASAVTKTKYDFLGGNTSSHVFAPTKD